MEWGYIKIEESQDNQLIVEAKLVNGTLWITKHGMADLFNVFVSSVDSNLRSIFKSKLLYKDDVTRTHKFVDKGHQFKSKLLYKDDVTRTHKFVNKGHQCEMTLYNLEALIFVSYRIASFEARAFREWVMKALTEYTRKKPKKETEVLIVYNLSSKLSNITLN
jgi:Virulence protein